MISFLPLLLYQTLLKKNRPQKSLALKQTREIMKSWLLWMDDSDNLLFLSLCFLFVVALKPNLWRNRIQWPVILYLETFSCVFHQQTEPFKWNTELAVMGMPLSLWSVNLIIIDNGLNFYGRPKRFFLSFYIFVMTAMPCSCNENTISNPQSMHNQVLLFSLWLSSFGSVSCKK